MREKFLYVIGATVAAYGVATAGYMLWLAH
jgi:hypothetical protein